MHSILTKNSHLLALVLGALTVFGFAPYYYALVPILTLSVLFYLWQTCHSAKQVFWLTFMFGLGLFGFGIYWIYISLHDFGGMPWWFAGFCTFCLCAFMALFPAGVGYASMRLGKASWLISAPVLWGLSDWVRSWIFTGFPWLTLGYSQVPHSPLQGYLPIVGVYGVSVITALTAMLLAQVWLKTRPLKWHLSALVFVFALGALLNGVQWTQPTGVTTRVALLQGNISQSIKWSPDAAQSTIDQYLQMVKDSQAQLIVLPETALPVVASQLPETITQFLTQHAQSQKGDVIVGMVDHNGEAYLNGAISMGMSPSQHYAKYHLVPFGEYIPLRAVFGWIYRDWLHMPLSDLARGAPYQTPMRLGEQTVAVNICYEDVFGEEIIHPLPDATLLVNISNDAWYGQSFAANQHLQFSQARAVETGRMVLRATNTGATAIISPNGQLEAHAPHDIQTVLNGEALGYQGSTPYVRWGNWPFIFISFALLVWVLRGRFLSKKVMV